MSNRSILKKSILLCGESDCKKFTRTFTIVRKISEGASVICYEAYHGGSGRGVLKEFYPKDAYSLERNADGQLVASAEFGDANERFSKAEKRYIEPYEMLQNAKKSGDSELSAFIPPFEIYYGCDSDCNIIGTVYIWTPEPELETFDKICDDIHKHPSQSPEHKLVTALTAIESLTKCICSLHSLGMLHRDIKPSNFGFIKHRDETFTQTLSMFDIDSVCSVYSDIYETVGTKGFMEPEAEYCEPDNRTDIFSIGATLFYAIAVTDETKSSNYLYREEYYGRLSDIVAQSRLICASEANSHPRLRNILSTILQKCLCGKKARYKNCEALLDDLKTALYYALPSDIAKKSRCGEKWILTDIEKSLDKNKEKNSYSAIQYHLYAHPLYECLPDSENNINVLILGFGNYGQKFLDLCLQAGQIADKTLSLTVVSSDETDKEIYLAERPELNEFFNIDGSLRFTDDVYGSIDFMHTSLDEENSRKNSDIIDNLLSDKNGGKPYCYVFIALGEDKLNFSVAKICCSLLKQKASPCSVNYVCEDAAERKNCKNASPVCVNESIADRENYREIERMALNTHLVWEKDLNIDYSKVRANFRKKYNHDSCVSSVLSLKYKLHSVGLDLEQCGFDEAARKFAKTFLSSTKQAKEIKNKLIWIEHRRWVTEKLCLGWRRIKDLSECSGGMTKDEKRKRHICILRSSPKPMLALEYKANGFKKWDAASDDELEQLDELDRMSVKLHRLYSEKAAELKNKNLLSGSNITEIQSLIGQSPKAEIALNEWLVCIKAIRNGDLPKIKLYAGLKNAFLDKLIDLSADTVQSVKAQLKAFEAMFYPILASNEYRDWKQSDTAIIENIPFILTYSENSYTVIPYSVCCNTDIFGNVAAATVINPSKILYLYLAENKRDIDRLFDTVPCILQYIDKKRLKCSLDFILIHPDISEGDFSDYVDDELTGLGAGKIRSIKHIFYADISDLSDKLIKCLTPREKGKQIFAVEINETKLSYMLQSVDFYDAFESYRFNSLNLTFDCSAGCEAFKYINKSPYISVADMLSLRLSSGSGENQPEYFDCYKKLWSKYRENSGVWKMLCGLLGKYSENNDVLAYLRIREPYSKTQSPRKYRYIIPFDCIESSRKIIGYLIAHNIIEAESKVGGYTSDSCEVIVADSYGLKDEFDKLFSNIYALMTPNAVTLTYNAKTRESRVIFDNLTVSGVSIDGGKCGELANLLKYFNDEKYIFNLNISENMTASFTYSSYRIKRLLTVAGKILEIYVYHKAKELGQFDDVVSGFETNREDADAYSEFYCILTKGFRSIFVECTSEPTIEQRPCNGLSGITNQFGINATAVLISDVQESGSSNLPSVNNIQRQRGDLMGIITVWKPDDINNIGHTLLKILNGKFDNGEEYKNV